MLPKGKVIFPPPKPFPVTQESIRSQVPRAAVATVMSEPLRKPTTAGHRAKTDQLNLYPPGSFRRQNFRSVASWVVTGKVDYTLKEL